MARIIAIDYGKKRTGLAVTDPMKMIATGLTTVLTHELIPFIRKYIQKEAVEKFLIGYPTNLDGKATDATALVDECIRILNKNFPDIAVVKADERFSSKMAARSLRESGLSKTSRREKALVDEVSATILLQDYLQSI